MSLRLTRLELALVAAIFAIGFGLRAAYPSRMAVEHFDEGVYASNLYTPEGRYPFQHLYAPPLLPFCLEMAAIFGGPRAVMWVNVLSGSLTLLVLWGMVREWWGPPAAMAAMVLLAFNEFHIAYSRAALTDAMLGLWMTAGVWAGWRAIQFGGLGNIVAAGVLASLAWWTKYNGWLTLAITGSGTAGWILFSGARSGIRASGGRQPTVDPPGSTTSAFRRKIRSPAGAPVPEAPKTDTVFGAARLCLGRWALTAAIAFLLWSPWLWELQQYGGYAAVAENHAGYFTGVGLWASNAWRQFRAFGYSFDVYSSYGWVFALFAPVAVFPACLRRRPCNGEKKPQSLLPRITGTGPAAWFGLAWVLGLLVAIPLYTPYPRLILSLLPGLAALFAMTMFGDRIVTTVEGGPAVETESEAARARKFRLGLTAFLVILLLSPPTWGLPHMPAWANRNGLVRTANDIIARLKTESLGLEVEGARCVVSVVAEPGLFFHLSAAQRNSPIGHVAVPAADFGAAESGSNPSGLPVYVITGPHADQSEAERLIAEGRLELVAEFEYRPSDLVLLDSRPAWDLPPKDKPVVERIRLFHVKP